MEAWHYWLIAAIALCALEMFSGDFLLASVGLACGGASAAAWCGAETSGQLWAFVGSAALVLGVVRPLAKRFLYRGSEAIVSNTAALVGQSGLVVDGIVEGDVGRVKLGGEEWRAEASGGGGFGEGQRVSVVSVSGATLTVEEATKRKD